LIKKLLPKNVPVCQKMVRKKAHMAPSLLVFLASEGNCNKKNNSYRDDLSVQKGDRQNNN